MLLLLLIGVSYFVLLRKWVPLYLLFLFTKFNSIRKKLLFHRSEQPNLTQEQHKLILAGTESK